jgi:hypothetical protein
MSTVALEQQLQNLSLGGRYRDLSLVLGIKDWSDSKPGKSVQEFLDRIEQFAKVSRWTEEDTMNIIKSKLQGEAAQFVTGFDELNKNDVTCDCLTKALTGRFTEQLLAQFYFNQLYKARQEPDKTPLHFLDRLRIITGKTMRRAQNPIEQKIISEAANFRLLTTFINGMQGVVSKELRYRTPQSVEEAVELANTVHHAVKLEKIEEIKFSQARSMLLF